MIANHRSSNARCVLGCKGCWQAYVSRMRTHSHQD